MRRSAAGSAPGPAGAAPGREPRGASSRRPRRGANAVVNAADRLKPRGRVLRREIALRRSKELEADHDLANRRRSQQRRIEVRVEMDRLVRAASNGLLMKAHGVRKRRLEQIV